MEFEKGELNTGEFSTGEPSGYHVCQATYFITFKLSETNHRVDTIVILKKSHICFKKHFSNISASSNSLAILNLMLTRKCVTFQQSG